MVTRDDRAFPAECRPLRAGENVAGLIRAFNSGSSATTDFVAREPSFVWWAVLEGPRKEGRNFVTYDRNRLDSYFTERHQKGEQLRLVQMDLQYDPGRDIAHLGLLLERRADDLNGGNVESSFAAGKGAIDCATGLIIVWVLTHGDSSGVGDCPPPSETQASLAVVCARA